MYTASEHIRPHNGWARPGSIVVLAALTLVSPAALALTQMSESEMSSVSGQDGITVQIEASDGSINAEEVRWSNDTPTETPGNAFSMRDVSLAAPGDYPVTVTADVGSNSGVPVLALNAIWDELGFAVGAEGNVSDRGMRLRDSGGGLSPQSGGQIGFFSSGGLTVVNEGGIFNSSSTNAQFDLSFSTPTEPGDFIIRHGDAGSPEFSFGNANLSLSTVDCQTNDCTLGIDNNGPYLSADLVNLDLNFDLMFNNASTTTLQDPDDQFAGYDRGRFGAATERQGLIKFGWSGQLSNFNMSAENGSIAGSEGLRIDTSFDYESDFSLTLGKAGVNRARAVFNGFERLYDRSGTEPTEPEFSLPLTVDVVPGGTDLGNICFGGATATTCGAGEEEVSLSMENRTGLAGTIRDAHMRAYNTTVDLDDPADGSFETFNWSLGYTFGGMDSNIVLYPGFDSNQDDVIDGSDSTGLTADVVLSVNSPGFWNEIQNQGTYANPGGDSARDSYWATNTHFFIGDTNTAVDVSGDGNPGDAFGFGLMNSDLIWRADGMSLRVASNSDTAFESLAASNADIPSGGIPFGDYNDDGDYTDGGGGFWLQSSSGIRYQFRGVLGGGDLEDDLSFNSLAKIAVTDVRLDTDRFVFALTPPPQGGADAIGFEALFDFNSNTYLSLAEPSDPNAEARIDISGGRIMWRNGKVEIASAVQNPDNRASLTIANDLQIGSTAAGGDPLRGDLTFAGEPLGEAVIPSGQFYSNIQLKPQSN